MANRDDFSAKLKEALARRVGYHCSNPTCQKLTIGPSTNPMGTVNIGVAAHITAAARGGKRYDPNLTPEERRAFDNGIWLCQNCAKLIDSDEQKYTIDVLRNWKIEAENNARNNLEGIFGFSSPKMDRTLVAQGTLLEQLGEMLSNEADKTIEMMRNTWREGHKNQARDQLKALKSDRGRWDVLSNQVKAKILRFEAGLVLDSENGLLDAKNLADQAYSLDPSDENQTKIMALIARQEGNVNNAIHYLQARKDVDSLNMLAAFYLELGDNLKCQKALGEINSSIANAETYRLRALLHLFNREIEQARIDITKAEQFAPRWYVVRLNRAMIDFFSAVSDAILPNRPILWPEPITPDMVKHDIESISYLQNADKLFDELSKYENPGVDSEIIRNWQLACHLVNLAKQDDIAELIHAKLKSNPIDYYLVIWALELNYDFDFATSESALFDLLGSDSANLFHVIALSGLLIKRRVWTDAEKVLTDNRPLFSSQNAESLWAFWMVQVLGLQGKVDDANRLIDQFEFDQNLRYAKGLVISVQAQKSGSNFEIMEYLEQQFADTNDPLFLLQACRLKFSEHDWNYVAERAKSLVDYYQTADILRFAIVAAFNSQRFGLCLELLEEKQFMFGKEIPGDIRRLKAISLRAQGLVKDAIAEMEAIPSQSTQSLFQMAHMYLQQGDLKKFTLVGRQLSEKPDLGSIEALQLAHYLRQEDPELAKAFYKKAGEGDLPRKQLGNLLFTAFKLGLDYETKPIHELMGRAQGEETGLTLVSLEELKDFFTQDNAEALRIQNLLMMGNIPVHFFADKRNINLVHFYHTFLEDNERQTDVSGKAPLFVRHGGKPISDIVQNPNEISLFVDITSIILAEHLGILEVVDKSFKTVNIPAELIVSLIEMREQVLPHQPSQAKVADLLVALVEQGKLRVLETDFVSSSPLDTKLGNEPESLATYAKNNGGRVLVFTNLLSKDSVGNISETVFINAKNVVNSLLRQGKISLEKQAELVNLLGTEGTEESLGSNLQMGMPLYCWQNTVDLFAGAGILEMICNQFDVYIQSDYLNNEKRDLQSYKRQKDVSNWLANLIEKLRQGIDSGKYRFMSMLPSNDNVAWEFDRFNNLRALFVFPKAENALIWSDDRHLNSFSNLDGIPIVGINEVLNVLLLGGSIDQKTYFYILKRIRAANLLFVPINADEIYYHLLQAPRDGTYIIETPDLVDLKSYAMRALELANYLQKPASNQANQQGEVAFLFQYAHAPQDAVGKIWETENLSTEDKRLLSNWILDNLFVDYPVLSNMLEIVHSKENQEYLAALKLTGLLAHGLSLPGMSKANLQSLRAAYLDWVYERFIGLDANLNPSVLNISLDLLKHIILDSKQESEGQVPPDVLDLRYQSFCSDLPEPIRQLLEEDGDFIAAIGVQFWISIGSYQFDPDVFWNAIGEVAKSGEVKVIPHGYDYPISIMIDSQRNESGALAIYDQKVDNPLPIRVPEFEILDPDKNMVISFLRKTRNLFDCWDNEFTNLIKDILSAPSPRLRVEKFLKRQELNLASHYWQLLERLRERQNFAINELLPPNTNDIARFLRVKFRVQKPFSLIWKNAIKELLNSHSIVETISRAWGIPVILPKAIYSRFDILDPRRLRKDIKALLQSCESPISMMHLTKLLLHLGMKNPAYQRLGGRKLKYMVTEAFEAEVKAFISVLNWTAGHLRTSEHDLSVIKLLAIWSHAHQLYSVLKAAHAPVDWIQEFFSEHPILPGRLLESERELHYDVSYPRNLTAPSMILSGIAYCTADTSQHFSEDFQLSVANICFLQVNERVLPHPFLMDDVTTLTDQLESIWAGDRGDKLTDVLGAEISALLSSSSLHELVEGVLNNLESHKQELPAWINLFATMRGVCIPENIKDRLVAAFLQTNFSQLFEQDVAVGRLAFHLASILTYTTASEELVLHLTDQLKESSKKLGKLYPAKAVNRLDEDAQKGLSDTVGAMLEVSLNISKLRNALEERAITFAEFGKEAAKYWDYFAIRSRPVIQTLSERLPVEQSRHVGRLLIFLRTIE